MKIYLRDFKQYLFSYLSIFIAIELINQLLVIPAFRLITMYLFSFMHVPLDSIRNIQTIIDEHPLILLCFILEAVVLFLILFSEFNLIVNAVREVHRTTFSFAKIFRLNLFSFKNIFLFLNYSIFVAFFLSIIFRTPLLVSLHLPEFIMDYMSRSWWLLLIFAVYLITSLIFAIKWLKNKLLLKKLTELFLLASLAAIIFDLFVYLLQKIWTVFPGKYLRIVAIFNLDLIQLVNELALLFLFAEVIVMFLHEGTGENKIDKSAAFYATLCLLAFIFLATSGNLAYLKPCQTPVVISHRGVDNKNGVQNTIAALTKTAKQKPDYVEIDVHETKDNQFVVMHDETLQKLAGKDKRPKELTLAQLTKLKIHENGYQANVASFDQYLKMARKLHQKLLIEIKTTPQDSKNSLRNFNSKYARTILKNKDLVQSLDYHVIEKIHELNPKIPILYLQPYNFSKPIDLTNGYAMEYSTVNNQFTRQAHKQGKLVFVWTLNSATAIKKALSVHADGIITDNLSLAKKTIRQYQREYSYTYLIRNYLLVEPAQLDFLV